METGDEIRKHRKPGYDINPLILNRWSPRAMSGESIDEEELMSLFEAARWAPSAFNNQLWRFIYARRETGAWERLFGLLSEWNGRWCASAAALVVVISRRFSEYKDKPAPTHAFDCGAAWENLALEGTSRGLVVHAMSGFDHQRARDELGIPDEFEVMAMVAIGRRAEREVLAPDLQEKEFPSDRRPLDEIVMEGSFKERKGGPSD
jgi:nitroreductase